MSVPPISFSVSSSFSSLLNPQTKNDPPSRSPALRSAQDSPSSTADGGASAPPPRLEIERLSGMDLPASALESPDARIRVLAVIAAIERSLHSSIYQHGVQIDEEEGLYRFDCSQMVSWILRRATRLAYAQAHGLAGNIFHGIDQIPPDHPTRGLRHVARIADLLPGDVIAWRTPPGLPSRVSGHVVIAAGPPVAFRRGYLVRVVDSTSYPHGEDSRAGGSGFGYGTMYFETDPATGEGIGYGWTGRYSERYVLRTRIAVGRPLN